MQECNTALNTFKRWRERDRAEEFPDDNGVASALRHIKTCKACILRRGLEKRLDAGLNGELLSFLPGIAEAIGLSKDEISWDTEIFPFQVVSILMHLNQNRLKRPRQFMGYFPERRMTMGDIFDFYYK
jgi:hypothetical protein